LLLNEIVSGISPFKVLSSDSSGRPGGGCYVSFPQARFKAHNFIPAVLKIQQLGHSKRSKSSLKTPEFLLCSQTPIYTARSLNCLF
jgi:hypothetical protein